MYDIRQSEKSHLIANSRKKKIVVAFNLWVVMGCKYLRDLLEVIHETKPF